MLFLYDDLAPPPGAIRQIISIDHFGDLLKRRRRLSDMIEDIVVRQCGQQFLRISDPASRKALTDRLERRIDDAPVFRLPSCLMPTDIAAFVLAVRKLPYALGSVIFGDQCDDEAAMLLSQAEVLALFRIDDPGERRAFFATVSDRATRLNNGMRLVDLREIGTFLQYMIGATEARHFNDTRVANGIFRKASTDKAKMEAEYRFFHAMPEPMRRFFLPTFDFQETATGASYAMENMPIPDAAIQFVHNAFEPASFDTLLARFFDFLATREREPVGTARVRETANREIVGKMHRRIEQLMATDTGRRLDTLMKASGPFGGVLDMQARFTPLIERALMRDGSDALAVSHGDPCLSNILFNREIGLFRLIDPRGALTRDDALMHPLYDVAKFSHSVMGGYDFINNGLFDCQLDDGLTLTLALHEGGPPAWMRQAFQARVKEAGFDMVAVRATELSLFMSMLPLHMDAPRKLPGFCLAACRIAEELEGRG